MKQSLVKKLTAGILTGALAISVTACGGNSADTNNASTNADVSAETENSGDVTVINAVTGGSPKPYISVEEDGSYSGYDIEVLQAVFDRLPQVKLVPGANRPVPVRRVAVLGRVRPQPYVRRIATKFRRQFFLRKYDIQVFF